MLPALEAAELPADAIEVGRIVDAWGIKGWFKIVPHSAQPEALFSSKRWFIQPSGPVHAKPQAGAFRLAIREAKQHSDCIVATSDDVADRNAAEALRGARVFVPRSSFPTAGDGEYYWVDLIGLSVVNREGVVLGTVRELLANGPQTTLVIEGRDPPAQEGAEVASHDGAKTVERMVPFVAAFVDDVDLAGRTITVDWQPDY
jgi:16S rRNA processing protein RimM